MRFSIRLAILLALAGTPLAAQGARPAADRCESAPAAWPAALVWLGRARQAIGFPAGDSVLNYRATELGWYVIQSDRSYPPFAANGSAVEGWLDPKTAVERRAQGAASNRGTLLTGRAAVAVRDTVMVPQPQVFAAFKDVRELNPWAVLADWSAAASVRVIGRCWIRDFWRVTLARPGVRGEERLYLDPASAYPVGASRQEPHYLWGTVRVDYTYSTWFEPHLPVTAHRQVDGVVEITRAYGAARLMPRDSAPLLSMPNDVPDMRAEVSLFLQPNPPDTVRVGPAAYLLRNRGYTEAVVLARDTIWVLDATQAEARAALDSAWIGRLFPGRHPIAVVVTDLAWPHIGGVRYWVAQGATIVTHRLSRDFLTRVVERRWTDAPDLLERRRATARLRLRLIDAPTDLAGGAVRVVPLEGLGTEGALAVYVPGEKFLWAGDYLQNASRPSLYATEVARTMRARGIAPERTAAQHLPLTLWSVIERLAPP
ncbi:MAG: hypothetical protein HOP28_15155 [Gemmatimonadales bacterium]|nr:hypothetical protein [Gemmatimonadales bacterium]